MIAQPFNANLLKTVTLSIPKGPNWFFVSDPNIAAININALDYQDQGLIVAPGQLTGVPGAAAPSFTPPPAGADNTAPGGAEASLSGQSFYTIGGRQPGFGHVLATGASHKLF